MGVPFDMFRVTQQTVAKNTIVLTRLLGALCLDLQVAHATLCLNGPMVLTRSTSSSHIDVASRGLIRGRMAQVTFREGWFETGPRPSCHKTELVASMSRLGVHAQPSFRVSRFFFTFGCDRVEEVEGREDSTDSCLTTCSK